MKQSSQAIQSKGYVEKPAYSPSRGQTMAEAYSLAVEWSGSIQTIEVTGGEHMSRFMGEPMAQNWPDLLIWEVLFDQYPIKTFIELGSGHGGMALFFALQCYQREIDFHTFDNQWLMHFDAALPKLMGMKEKFHFVDIFNDGLDELTALINTCPRPLAIFFDDGDKPREWQTFGPLTRPGDICAVHDWGTEFKEKDIGDLPVQRILGNLSDSRPEGWKAMWFQRV
jgi:hypothetical protein